VIVPPPAFCSGQWKIEPNAALDYLGGDFMDAMRRAGILHYERAHVGAFGGTIILELSLDVAERSPSICALLVRLKSDKHALGPFTGTK
jgi:hypothetical protein